ncbi:MAG: Gfo/Idh/MocA family oxidoreductase [Paracoccaceae bacterium]|nr:Gfo/Idh/MocA family oxidoreductase [Paracoccaceae bacterium]
MTLRIAIAGAGLIGHRHAAALQPLKDAVLCAIIDPAPVGATVASEYDVPHYATLSELITNDRPDGIVLATPNQFHVDNALECIAAGIPILVEKPLAIDVAGASQIVQAADQARVPVLTGHHRRHNPLIARAKEVIESGQLGKITAVQASTWLCKPDDYFDVQWRREKGAGPVYINLIHDIDLLRHLCGEIVSVHAMESNATRGFDTEDTAVILLKFAGGALGTVNVSDTVVSPWSWELTARENPMYPATDQACYQIGGTNGGLSLPNLSMWTHPQKNSWWEPISETKLVFDFEDPLVLQLKQFADVIAGKAEPLVSAIEGLRNQQVLDAVKSSAATGQTAHLTI